MTRDCRVMIVDDQEAFRSVARMVVELVDGFEVAGESPSGEHAIEQIEALVPDVILMDLKMPGMDGLEATRRIVAAHPDIRIIVLSTYGAEDYEAPALEAGAVAFVSKSDFGPGVLLAAVS